MKNIGVWLDGTNALIIDGDSIKVIPSGIEHFHIHGGSGSRLKGGPQDVVQDSKYLEREKHQLKKYFKNISLQINEADTLVIFGPAEIYEKFYRELKTHYIAISVRVKGVIRTPKMTNNQIVAWVKNFYKNQE